MDIKDYIRSVPDFPKPGILFYDISTLLAHADAWSVAMGRMAKTISRHQPDILAGQVETATGIDGTWSRPEDLHRYALPTVMRKICDHAL